MTKSLIGTIAQGQAGVLRVASELILRGHVPYFPACDNAGIDVVADGSVRIQVKTTMRPSSHWRWREGTFIFALGKVTSSKGRVKMVRRKFSAQCDVVVLWAIEANRFWIVPAHLLDGRHTFIIGPKQQWVDVDVTAARALRARGSSYREIAEHLGVPCRTLMRRLNLSPVPRKSYPSIEVRQYEGRWDVISSLVALQREANRIVAQPAVPESVTE